MQRALDETLAYSSERKAFGKPIGAAEHPLQARRGGGHGPAARAIFIDRCSSNCCGKLDVAPRRDGQVWVTEKQGKVIDECLQLFGGYGYMSEYPIAGSTPTPACSASTAARTRS